MEVTILATSDMHGYILPTNFHKGKNDLPFGAARVGTVIKEERERASGPVFVIENGDYIQGSPLSYYIAKEKADPFPLINVLNQIGYDAGVIGNHEFNYGLNYLRKAIKAANFPVLCANIVDENNESAFGKAYEIIEKDGIKIAVLGLTTKYIYKWELPESIKGLRFKSIVETAKEYIDKLKGLADAIIVSYHGGFECDLETGEATEMLTGENEAYTLLKDVKGIDALITGHQHRRIASMVNGVPVVQPGSKGEAVGKIVLRLEKDRKGKYYVYESEAKLVETGNATEDRDIIKGIEGISLDVEKWLDNPLGKVIGDMKIYDANDARKHEHPYVEFIQRVQMSATRCDISLAALFDNEGKGFSEVITMRDVVTNYIYPNTLAVLKVSGSDLKLALERSASFFKLNDDGSIGVNEKFIYPKPQYYNYDMYEGINYTINVSNPVGSRITSITYHGKEVKIDDSLEIVMNQYRATGGGDYEMFNSSKIQREVQVDMTELIARYLKESPVVIAKVNNNFKVTNK